MAQAFTIEQVRGLYSDWLKEEGYVPKPDDEGDIEFKREGRLYRIDISENDLEYLSISSIEDYQDILRDRCHALEVINYVQSKYKTIKLRLHDGDEMFIIFRIQNFLDAPDAFRNVLHRSLDLLVYTINRFERLILEFDTSHQSSA